MGNVKTSFTARLGALALTGTASLLFVTTSAQAQETVCINSNASQYPEQPLDFGDAPHQIMSSSNSWSPVPAYPTKICDLGAAHVVSDSENVLRLGQYIDVESDGQPSEDALGDDNNAATLPWYSTYASADGPVDDEDGIQIVDGSPFDGNPFLQEPFNLDGPSYGPTVVAGQRFIFRSEVNGAPKAGAKLSAFFDFYRAGNWLPPAVSVIGKTVKNGFTDTPVNVPADAVLGPSFARFRLSTQRTLLPTGVANDGEVEDYRFTILAPSSLNPEVTTYRPSQGVLVFAARLRVVGGYPESGQIGYGEDCGTSSYVSNPGDCVVFRRRSNGQFLCRGYRDGYQPDVGVAAAAAPQPVDFGLYTCQVYVPPVGGECDGKNSKCKASTSSSSFVDDLLKNGFNVQYYGNPEDYYAPSSARGYVRALR